jgi:hypothetical protein
MAPVYTNAHIRMEFAESGKRESILADAQEIIGNLKENGFQHSEATRYVNDHFVDLLSELLSGGIISRTVQEIGSTPEYHTSPERAKSHNEETTFTLTKQFSVDVGKISPYIDVCVNAGLVELKRTRFSFAMTGTVTLENPSITVYGKKIVRAALGTVTPSFSLYYVSGGEEKLIHTFEKEFVFNEIELKGTEPDGYREPASFKATA